MGAPQPAVSRPRRPLRQTGYAAMRSIARGNYHLVHETKLREECKKRGILAILPGNIIDELNDDDEHRKSCAPGIYEANCFDVTMQRPPYLEWDRYKLDKLIQSQDNYPVRLLASNAAAAHNATIAASASLISLSPELSTIIYLHALFDEDEQPSSVQRQLIHNHRAHPFTFRTKRRRVLGYEPALLRTCKVIRAECLPIWYGNVRYHFEQKNAHLEHNEGRDITPSVLLCFEKWANALGEHDRLGMLRQVRVELGGLTLTVESGMLDFHRHSHSDWNAEEVAAGAKTVLEVLGKHMDLGKLKLTMRIRPAVYKGLGIQKLGYELKDRMKRWV